MAAVARVRKLVRTLERSPREGERALPDRCEVGPAGVLPGINTGSGNDDDGWTPPPPVTLADGTRLQLYKDGEALAVGLRAVREARRRICLEVYIFADDPTGHAYAEALCRQSRDGVQVFVIYDSFGTRGAFGGEPEMFAEMRRSGVRVGQFNPMRPWECQFSWRPGNRDHRKLLVIDDDLAGMGGLNVGKEYAGAWVARAIAGGTSGKAGKVGRAIGRAVGSTLGSTAGRVDEQATEAPPALPREAVSEAWRDNAVSIRGPAARYYLDAFRGTWNYVTRGGRIRKTEFRHHIYDGALGLLASAPTMDSPLRPMLHRLMRGARQSLLMTMAYFAPDDDLIDELCRAGRRGVRVRLMLPGRCDIPAVRVAARSFYGKLLDAGVEIYERQGVILHAKTMVIDASTTVIGSTNLDYRSIEYNLELSSVIRNPIFGQQMHMLFENDVRYASRITPEEWKRLRYWDHFVQWTVSRLRYLL